MMHHYSKHPLSVIFSLASVLSLLPRVYGGGRGRVRAPGAPPERARQ
jgi:hypothetical protein